MVRAENKIQVHEAITPEQLYYSDAKRGSDFSGPTPEEVLEWDELTVERVDDMKGAGWTANLAEEKLRLESLVEFYRLVRVEHGKRSELNKQMLEAMEERGDLPWQHR